MMKLIDFLRSAAPSMYPYEFTDHVTVYDEDARMIFSSPHGRTTPNAIKPRNKKGTLPAWDAHYGCIALGVYNGVVAETKARGKFIRILGDVPTVLPNPAQNNWHIMNGVLIHCSDKDNWPGSAGCLTIKKSEWKKFISLFKLKENVKVHIRGIM